MATSSSGVPSTLPPPRPKSPPEYPDLYGKRRELAKVQMLEREISFLEGELKFVQSLPPASQCCKEVADFVVANPDPFIPTTRRIRRSCRFWKWLCGAPCFNFSSMCCCFGCTFSSMCCCFGCTPHLEMPSCCNCSLQKYHSCIHCSMPKCRCCSWPRLRCFGKISCCSRKCCTPRCLSCPDCYCRCSCSWPKCPKLNLCCCCTKSCCYPSCLRY